MSQYPQVRIVLDDCANGGSTWITVAPINRSYPHRSSGVVQATMRAAGMFIENILNERELVAERLIERERLQESRDQD